MKAQEAPLAAPLVSVTRGPLTESLHRGHVVAVEPDGRLVASLGAPETVAYLRSSCKPQQAVPLVASGASARFRLDARELALTCGSHSGEIFHTETVAGMLRKLGLDESALKCGAHEPYSEETARRLSERGQRPSQLHNNCSGKHAGMLALALHLGASVEEYDQPSSPAQRAVLQSIREFSGVAAEEIAVGVDGCGLPTFGVSLRAAALLAARLVSPPSDWEESVREACMRLVSAMLRHPEMVEGTGEMDTEIMLRTGGRLVSKVGAEAFYAASILPCEEWPRGLGVALKIEDGDRKERARPVAVVETLRQLGVLHPSELNALARFASDTLRNHRGDHVGEVRPAFELKKL